MDMYRRYVSPLGYRTGNDSNIDSYGVDHSGFSTRDEIEYQMARQKRENELKTQYASQGITKNLPQYGTSFWGNSANNYGFGMTNITDNIANIKNTTTPIPQATVISQQSAQPQIWDTAVAGKQVYNNVVRNEGNYSPQNHSVLKYISSATKAIPNIASNYLNLKNANLTDKYKHAFMNCDASQYGRGGEDIAQLASNAREFYDVMTRANSLDSSEADQYANQIGRLLGSKYPNGDCDALIQRYIKKYW